MGLWRLPNFKYSRHSVSHGHTHMHAHTHACTHRHNTKALFSQMEDMLSFAELSRTPILRPFPGVLPQKGWFYRVVFS